MAPARFLSALHVRKLREARGMGRAQWMLVCPLVFHSALVGRVHVPAGFISDFASVPRLPLAFLFAGDTAHASAVVHDFLVRGGVVSWRTAAAVFAEAMAAEGVPRWRRWLMSLAVRLAAPPAGDWA